MKSTLYTVANCAGTIIVIINLAKPRTLNAKEIEFDTSPLSVPSKSPGNKSEHDDLLPLEMGGQIDWSGN